MEEKHSLDETFIDELLSQVLEHGNALLLQVGRVPYVQHRLGGHVRELKYEACQPQHIQSMVYDIISDEQIARFEQDLELAFVHTVHHKNKVHARFLVLATRDWRGNVAASFLALSHAL